MPFDAMAIGMVAAWRKVSATSGTKWRRIRATGTHESKRNLKELYIRRPSTLKCAQACHYAFGRDDKRCPLTDTDGRGVMELGPMADNGIF